MEHVTWDRQPTAEATYSHHEERLKRSSLFFRKNKVTQESVQSYEGGWYSGWGKNGHSSYVLPATGVNCWLSIPIGVGGGTTPIRAPTGVPARGEGFCCCAARSLSCCSATLAARYCAAHWRSCVSFVRWIWSLSQSSFSLWLQEQKIYCKGIWPEDNFILREGQRVMGRRKKNKQKKSPPPPQKKTTTKKKQTSKQKRRYTKCPLKMLLGHASCWFVHSEHRLLLTQWGTTKDKRMQHTSPANFNNSECRTRSFLAAGGRWKLPLKQQSRSSVKQG